jgi:hypothetical protein
MWNRSVLARSIGRSSPGLRLTTLDSSVQKPSNVAVYFTVDTDDESKHTILNPEVAADHFTLLVVDMSGSVSESGDVPAIVDAASAFSDRVGKYQTLRQT